MTRRENVEVRVEVVTAFYPFLLPAMRNEGVVMEVEEELLQELLQELLPQMMPSCYSSSPPSCRQVQVLLVEV